MPALSPNWVASGNINPSRFVAPTGTTNAFKVAQCGAGGVAVGISQEGAKAAPIDSASTLAAAAGDGLRVYGIGEVCLLSMAATCNAGAYLKSDANGEGTPVTTDKDAYGAIALQDCTSTSDLIPVLVTTGYYAV